MIKFVGTKVSFCSKLIRGSGSWKSPSRFWGRAAAGGEVCEHCSN